MPRLVDIEPFEDMHGFITYYYPSKGGEEIEGCISVRDIHTYKPSDVVAFWMTNGDRTWCSKCGSNSDKNYSAAVEEDAYCSHCGVKMSNHIVHELPKDMLGVPTIKQAKEVYGSIFITLTMANEDNPVCFNTDNITHVIKDNSGCRIFVGRGDYYILVKESYEKVLEILGK